MAISLRCKKHTHLEFDPEQGRVLIKCRWCSKGSTEGVYHEWVLRDLLRRYATGEVDRVCMPDNDETAGVAAGVARGVAGDDS